MSPVTARLDKAVPATPTLITVDGLVDGIVRKPLQFVAHIDRFLLQ